MIVAETIFVSSKPVGVVRLDTMTRQFAFSPIKGKSRLPEQEWRSMDELKAAVLEAYTKTKKIPAIKPGFSVLLTENTKQATTGDLTDERYYTRITPKTDSSLV